MREDLIEIENGTITTKEGLPLEVGKGWFIKEPPEEMIEAYKDIEIHPLHISDVRMALERGLVGGVPFEEDNNETSLLMEIFFGQELCKSTYKQPIRISDKID